MCYIVVITHPFFALTFLVVIISLVCNNRYMSLPLLKWLLFTLFLASFGVILTIKLEWKNMEKWLDSWKVTQFWMTLNRENLFLLPKLYKWIIIFKIYYLNVYVLWLIMLIINVAIYIMHNVLNIDLMWKLGNTSETLYFYRCVIYFSLNLNWINLKICSFS